MGIGSILCKGEAQSLKVDQQNEGQIKDHPGFQMIVGGLEAVATTNPCGTDEITTISGFPE